MRSICPLVAISDRPQLGSESFRGSEGTDDSFWIFELDNHGTILHCSPHPGQYCDPTMRNASGVNFFEEVDGLGNLTELQQRFKRFWSGTRPTESFCMYSEVGTAARPLKVTLTRTFQTAERNRLQTVMMEIKGNPYLTNLGGENGNASII